MRCPVSLYRGDALKPVTEDNDGNASDIYMAAVNGTRGVDRWVRRDTAGNAAYPGRTTKLATEGPF
jgi:hypothetical protein